MKKVFLTTFILSILLSFTGCGSDDPEKVEKYFNGVCKQTIAIQAYANQNTTIAPITSTLEDMLKDTPGYTAPISGGSFVVTGENTTIKIEGLDNMAEDVTLKGFILNINGMERNFGDITKTNAKLYTDEHLEYFRNVFNKMIRDGKLTTKITFTPTGNVDPADKIKLQISFDGKFSYWVTL
ncbi:MAG: hypothetical protein ACK5KT_11120 [Dysgonomonas sp.]